MRVSRLPARCKLDSCSSGIIASTDVSGEHISHLSMVKLNFEDGTDRCPKTTVTNYQSALRNIPEESLPFLRPQILHPSKLLLSLKVHQECSIVVGLGAVSQRRI
jgi:hypothetical protein